MHHSNKSIQLILWNFIGSENHSIVSESPTLRIMTFTKSNKYRRSDYQCIRNSLDYGYFLCWSLLLLLGREYCRPRWEELFLCKCEIVSLSKWKQRLKCFLFESKRVPHCLRHGVWRTYVVLTYRNLVGNWQLLPCKRRRLFLRMESLNTKYGMRCETCYQCSVYVAAP